MRSKLLFLLTIAVIFTVGFVSGCSGCSCQDEQHVYHLPEKDLEDGNSTHMDYSDMLPSEAELGAPAYADNLDPSSISSSKEETDGEVVHVGVDYSTFDDLDTVLAWYKSQLGEPEETQEIDGQYRAWWFVVKDGKKAEVIISGKADGTSISILNDKM